MFPVLPVFLSVFWMCGTTTHSVLKCSALNVIWHKSQLSGLQAILIMQLGITYAFVKMMFTISTSPGDNKRRQSSNKHLYVMCKIRTLDFCLVLGFMYSNTLL